MKHLGMKILTAIALLMTLASCDGVIYDDEGDCSVTYRLKFRYDYNMKFADAFPHEVKSVAVYAFDKNTGKLVWQKTDKGDALAQDGYSMTLDMPAGDYDLVAWCGLDNDATNESFSVPKMTVGTSTKQDLQCTMARQHAADGSAYVDTDLYGLYHGTLSINLPQNDDGGDYVYTMPLVKDTKHLRVILQHLSGKDVDVSKFTFTIETHKVKDTATGNYVETANKANENGFLDWDNSLIADEPITYKAWNTESGKAEVIVEGVEMKNNVAIADLSFSRIMADREMDLVIRNTEGKEVVRVPFVSYAVLVKGYYNKEMSNQEYLDRQDEYSMTFFLDDDYEWISASILINSWRVVLQNVEIGK